MVRTYLDAVQPVADETITHEGGTAYVADIWLRLRRFLILGTSGGTFYVGERELTIASLDAVRACLAEDGPRTVREIVAVGESGGAPKHDPVLFALALATTAEDLATRRAAFAAVPGVCRTGTHVLHFAAYRRSLAGWGRGAKQAVGRWFAAKTADELAYQAIKYPSRDGWALSDLLRLSHPKTDDPGLDAVFAWVVDGAAADATKLDALPEQIKARDWLQQPEHWTTEHRPHEVIRRLRLPREAIPSELLNDPETWEALLADMPITAMIRNLGKMSQVGLLTDRSAAARTVTRRLGDLDRLRKGRVHPIALLSALKVYEQGKGERGKLTWSPVKSVVTALDEAFYLAFGTIKPSGKRILCAVDVSGSMIFAAPGLVGLTCRDLAAAMALVTLATEPQAEVVGYSDRIVQLPLRPTMRLDEVVRSMHGLSSGWTYCALPIHHALERGRVYDAIVQYTDSESSDGIPDGYRQVGSKGRTGTYATLLRKYRQRTGTATRSVVAAFAANEISLADPSDPLALDVAGFDASGPGVIAEFIAGKI